jgi:hypothetical protein
MEVDLLNCIGCLIHLWDFDQSKNVSFRVHKTHFILLNNNIVNNNKYINIKMYVLSKQFNYFECIYGKDNFKLEIKGKEYYAHDLRNRYLKNLKKLITKVTLPDIAGLIMEF